MHMMQMHWALKKHPAQAKPRSKRRPLEVAVAAGTYDPFVKSQRHLRKAVGKPPPTMLVFTAPTHDDGSWTQPQPVAPTAAPLARVSSVQAAEPTPTGPAIQDAVDLLALSGPTAIRPKAKDTRSHPYARPSTERSTLDEPFQQYWPSAPAGGKPVSEPADGRKSGDFFNEEMIREMSVLAHRASAAGSLASMSFSNAGSYSCAPSATSATMPSPSDSYLQDVLTKRLVNEDQPRFVPQYLAPITSAPQPAANVGTGPRATCTTGGG